MVITIVLKGINCGELPAERLHGNKYADYLQWDNRKRKLFIGRNNNVFTTKMILVMGDDYIVNNRKDFFESPN